MATLSINHVNFHLCRPLLEEMRAFYCDVVGLRIGFRPAFNQFGYWLYADTVPLIHLSEVVGIDVRLSCSNSAFNHVAIYGENRQALVSRLDLKKVPYEITEVPETRQFQISLLDPAGHKVEFLCDANSENGSSSISL